MKLSEFDAISLSLWRGSPYSHTVGCKDYARCRREGAEAAGVVWEPEEEPLPEKIVAIFNVQWLPMIFLGPVEHGPSYRFLSEKEAGEVVRRYNAWPELEKVLRAMNTGDWSEGMPIDLLTAILRGGPR